MIDINSKRGYLIFLYIHTSLISETIIKDYPQQTPVN